MSTTKDTIPARTITAGLNRWIRGAEGRGRQVYFRAPGETRWRKVGDVRTRGEETQVQLLTSGEWVACTGMDQLTEA